MHRVAADGEVRHPPPPRTGTVRFSGMGKLCRVLRRRGDPGPPRQHFHQPPTGYSSAGCSPAEPASASPAASHSEVEGRSLSKENKKSKKSA